MQLGEAITIYLKQPEGAAIFRKVETAMRIWAAGAGGPRRSGARVTDSEKRQIDLFIESYEFSRFWDSSPLDVLDRGFRKLAIGSRSKSTYRNSFKKVLGFWSGQGWNPHHHVEKNHLPIVNPKGKAQSKSYRPSWRKAKKIILLPQESPPALNAEIQAFKTFCFNHIGINDGTYCEDFIRRYFGMLHREGMALENLGLRQLVPYVKPAERLTMTEVASGQIFSDNPIIQTARREGRHFEALAVAKELCREKEAEIIKYVNGLVDRFGAYSVFQASEVQ
jgi:hypothetical protein